MCTNDDLADRNVLQRLMVEMILMETDLNVGFGVGCEIWLENYAIQMADFRMALFRMVYFLTTNLRMVNFLIANFDLPISGTGFPED